MTSHTMHLTATADDGRELWRCLECGRAFLLDWATGEKVVLEEGDPTAAHVGSKAPAGLELTMQAQADDDDLSDFEDFIKTLEEP